MTFNLLAVPVPGVLKRRCAVCCDGEILPPLTSVDGPAAALGAAEAEGGTVKSGTVPVGRRSAGCCCGC